MKKQKETTSEGWTSLINDDEVNEIDKEIENLKAKKQEKEEIAKYRQKIKENKVLQENNIDTYDSKQQKVVKKSFYKLLKYSLIFLGIVIIGGIIVFAYLIDGDKLKSTTLCGDAKAECQVCSPCGNVNLTCETQVCNCPNSTLSCNFPTNISINLINSS